MANTYTWTIIGLPCYPEQDNLQDVVFQIVWRYNGTDGEGHFGEAYGTTDVVYEASAPFVPYSDLTQETIEGWLVSALGVDGMAAVTAQVDAAIDFQANPPVIVPPLPWAPPEPPPPPPPPEPIPVEPTTPLPPVEVAPPNIPVDVLPAQDPPPVETLPPPDLEFLPMLPSSSEPPVVAPLEPPQYPVDA